MLCHVASKPEDVLLHIYSASETFQNARYVMLEKLWFRLNPEYKTEVAAPPMQTNVDASHSGEKRKI